MLLDISFIQGLFDDAVSSEW